MKLLAKSTMLNARLPPGDCKPREKRRRQLSAGMKKALEEAPAKKPAKTKEADRRNDAGWIFVLPALLRPCIHDLAHRLSAIMAGERA